MKSSKMNPESELIKAVCQRFVNEDGGNKLDNILERKSLDWSLLKTLIGYHELAPFFYLALEDYKEFVPPEMFHYLSTHYYYTIADNLNKDSEYQLLASVFKEKGIGILPIKGVALLNDIYDELFMRPMVDIDVLVKKEDMSKASAAFHDLGYRKSLYDLKESYWLKDQCHIAFYKDRSLVEMHWGLDFERGGRQLESDVWARARVRETGTDKGTFRLLSPEDTFFSLALHKRRFGRTLSIKNVIDAALLLNRYKDRFDWDYIFKQSHNYGMKSTIFFMQSQIGFLFDTESPSLGKIKIPAYKKRLINSLIEQNTFYSVVGSLTRDIYLKAHFLLYDSFFEPIKYILNIPKEQFAKFYKIEAYDKKTDFLYRNRLAYMPFRLIRDLYNGRQ